MSNVPAARRQIAEIIEALETVGDIESATKLRDALDLLYRRSPVRRMRKKSPRITGEMRRQIIDLARTTDLHNAEIAAILEVNPGRVSEVLQRAARVN
jgi:hypothetical protein